MCLLQDAQSLDGPRNLDAVSGGPDGARVDLGQLRAGVGELSMRRVDVVGAGGAGALARQAAAGNAAVGGEATRR